MSLCFLVLRTFSFWFDLLNIRTEVLNDISMSLVVLHRNRILDVYIVVLSYLSSFSVCGTSLLRTVSKVLLTHVFHESCLP